MRNDQRGIRLALMGVFFALFILALNPRPAAEALPTPQTQQRPFILPMSAPPGPSTWLYGQPYGNTVGAATFGRIWYEAGQGLHFGLDFPMPCGTEIIASTAGEVAVVDGTSFGSGPHNVVLRHPQYNLATLYGHLGQRSTLTKGQWVEQGQLIGYSGDPDETCDSRPHLHFEIRDYGYRKVYNPVNYIDANWSALTMIGAYSWPLFQRDLYNARRWMHNDDQPEIQMGGRILNTYRQSLPLPQGERPPQMTQPYYLLPPLSPNVSVMQRPLTTSGCCTLPWWDMGKPHTVMVIDGAENQLASVIAYDTETGDRQVVRNAPPLFQSPDGSHAIENDGYNLIMYRTSDNLSWYITRRGSATPAISPDNTHLLWVVRDSGDLPGGAPTTTVYWLTDMNGMNEKPLRTHPGGNAVWLDANRILFLLPEINNWTYLVFFIYDLRDNTFTPIGGLHNVRRMNISPGGQYAMFYRAYQADPTQNGMFVLRLEAGATPTKLDWFGAWQWRDAESVYYIPFEPDQPNQRLFYYHIPTNTRQMLTGYNFQIKDGDWAVSPDGHQIVYLSAEDNALWLLEITDDEG